MPATVSDTDRYPAGGRSYAVRFTLTYSGTYAAGGEVVTAASLGLRYVSEVVLAPVNTLGVESTWDGTKGASPKVRLFVEDAISGIPAEASGTRTDVIRGLAYGV